MRTCGSYTEHGTCSTIATYTYEQPIKAANEHAQVSPNHLNKLIKRDYCSGGSETTQRER